MTNTKTPKTVVETEDVEVQRQQAVLERDVERAKKMAKIRAKQAPDIAAGSMQGLDELKSLIKYAREDELIPEDYETFFGDESLHNQYVGEGWIPVVKDREHLRHGDLKLYMTPKNIPESKRKASGDLSHKRLLDHLQQGPDRDDGKRDATKPMKE